MRKTLHASSAFCLAILLLTMPALSRALDHRKLTTHAGKSVKIGKSIDRAPDKQKPIDPLADRAHAPSVKIETAHVALGAVDGEPTIRAQRRGVRPLRAPPIL